jgi:hypothetical protein
MLSSNSELTPNPQVIVLDDLAQAIRIGHGAVIAAAGSVLEHAMEVGDLLIQVFNRIERRRRAAWLHEHCGIPLRTANNYIAIARGRTAIEAKRHGRADFGIRAALRLIGRSPDGPKKPARALSAAAWHTASPEERRAFVAAVGVAELLSVLPEDREEAPPLSRAHLASICNSLKLALGATNDNEALAALRAVNRILASSGRDYHNLIAALELLRPRRTTR